MKNNKEIIVIVSGVGAIIGQGVVKSLRKIASNIRIIGVDRKEDGIGPFLCDIFYKKPNIKEDTLNYLEFWINLIEKEKTKLIIPALEVDVKFFSTHKIKIESTGCLIALNNIELIKHSEDKWNFGEILRKNGFPHIPTTLARTWNDCQKEVGNFPMILKPRIGNGSRGIVKIENEADFRYWSLKSDTNFMLQKYIGDDEHEYTVGAFGLGNGEIIPPIIFKRKLSVAGNTQYAEVINNNLISEQVNLLAKFFKPIGPTNFQFRIEGEKIYLLEINPRMSSSTSLRSAFGYNEAQMCLEYFIDRRFPIIPNIKMGKGWRYYEDYIEYDSIII